MKRLINFIIGLVWTSYSFKHLVFTGRRPEESDKPVWGKQ